MAMNALWAQDKLAAMQTKSDPFVPSEEQKAVMKRIKNECGGGSYRNEARMRAEANIPETVSTHVIRHIYNSL